MLASREVDDLSRRRELRDSMWLALVPVGVAVVLGVLLVPRRAAPEAVPLPIADGAALARREVRLLEVGGLPPEYPTPLGFPEGRYLKLYILEA